MTQPPGAPASEIQTPKVQAPHLQAPGDWLAALGALAGGLDGGEGVLLTLAQVRGHAPREAGAKMVVSAGRCWGTVGGGNLEATAVARARQLLAQPGGAPELLTLRLNPQAPAEYGRQCCGGEVTLLLEPLRLRRPAVAVFGLGHVGKALAAVLATLPIELWLCDSRPETLTWGLPQSEGSAARLHPRTSPAPETVLAELPPGAHVVLLTHDHAEDLALCDAALRRPDLGFVGLIGSAVKWTHFQVRLGEAGHPPEACARITCPVGLPQIRGKAPAAVALSVAAQLQSIMEGNA